jgi:hypothetical protein
MPRDRAQITLRLPPVLYEQLQTEAGQMGVSANTYMVELMRIGRLHLREFRRESPRTPPQTF